MKIFFFLFLFFLPSFPGSADEKDPSFFHFIQVTDTHFGKKDHFQRTEKIIDAIQKLPIQIEFLVHCGDLTDNLLDSPEILDQGLTLFKKLGIPIHFIPGNHDILAENLQTTQSIWMEKISPLCYGVNYRGVSCLFFYSEPLRTGISLEKYDPFQKLEYLLKESGEKPVILFHHAPSVEDFFLNRFHDGWKSEYRSRWKQLLNSFNVKAVISGHFHRDELHWIGKIPLFVCPPVAGYHCRQAAFRIFHYHQGKLNYRTQYVE